MADQLDNGHVLTDEDVDTAQLIKQLDEQLGRRTDHTTLRIAATPLARVRQILSAEPTNSHRPADRLDGLVDSGQIVIVPGSVAEAPRSEAVSERPDA